MLKIQQVIFSSPVRSPQNTNATTYNADRSHLDIAFDPATQMIWLVDPKTREARASHAANAKEIDFSPEVQEKAAAAILGPKAKAKDAA